MDALAATRVLTIYRRARCSVCDEAEALLGDELAARVANGLAVPAIVRVDVSTSAELEARYGPRVPVLELDGRELDLVVTGSRVRALLDGAGRPATGA